MGLFSQKYWISIFKNSSFFNTACHTLLSVSCGLQDTEFETPVIVYTRHGQSAVCGSLTALQLIFVAHLPFLSLKTLIYFVIVYQKALKMAKCGDKAKIVSVIQN